MILLVTGTGGYMIIEGDNFLNALYMTVITMSTVGFGEIHKLSQPGKIFTIVLIIMSISTYAYSLTIITTFLMEGQIAYILRGYRKKSMHKMNNHIIICGYGRNGQQAARELTAHGQSFVVIDQNHDVIIKNADDIKWLIEGDATRDEVLLRANIEKARALITTLPIDADNLYVVLAARSLNPGLKIVSRASDESSEAKLKIAKADSVVMPEKVGGAHMAALVAKPDIIEFLEHLSVHRNEPTNLVEVICDNMPEEIRNKTINEIGIRKKTGVNIVGLKKPDGAYVMNPTPDTTIIPGSKLFILGTKDEIVKIKKMVGSV